MASRPGLGWAWSRCLGLVQMSVSRKHSEFFVGSNIEPHSGQNRTFGPVLEETSGHVLG